MASLGQPLRAVVGGRTAKALADGLDLHTVDDLLRHYPRRYARRGELTDLSDLRVDEHVTVLAEVARVTRRPMRRRRGDILEVEVTDGRGRLTLTFFNQAWRARELTLGRQGLFAGKVSAFRGKRQLAHPDYQLLTAGGDGPGDGDAAETFAAALIPVYPATSLLPSWRVAQCVDLAFEALDADVDDPLPEPVRVRHGLLGLREAFAAVHRPETLRDVARGMQRLKWDEALPLQLVLAARRADAARLPATPRVAPPGGLLADFDAGLPFSLTAGQRAVSETITADLAAEHPMHRLLQGEVGSGKTVVALRAMLTVVDAGGQAALLAPTEVLAQQHHRSVSSLLGALGLGGQLGAPEHATRVALLIGSQTAAARREALEQVASGEAGIVVGTHALIQEGVQFRDLGLVVVDEQHRFGVEQREALRAKSGDDHRPHTLVMTATPIPRTVAMTVFGDLEVSTLTELPQGRAEIRSHVVPAAERPDYLDRAWQRVREEVTGGHQAYVVCPRIGDDGGTGATGDVVAEPEAEGEERRPPVAVLDLAPELAHGALAGLTLGVLHGRLPGEEKDAVMRAFAAGEVDVLVATTVVEVGVDVPNASMIVIMDADRFGVSQLHQLRGRVGRGRTPGLCLLVTDAPADSPARVRLDAVAATLDGFALSRLDLEQRREGDVLGVSQSGRRSSLRALGVLRDEDVIRAAREEATDLVADDPALSRHPALAAVVADLFAGDRAAFLEKA